MRISACVLVLLICSSLAAEDKSVLGWWVNPDDPDDTTAFEKDRAITLDHGKIQYWLARSHPRQGGAGLDRRGLASPTTGTAMTLIVDNAAQESALAPRLQHAQGELLEQEVLTIPKPMPLVKSRSDAIGSELDKRRVEDQAVRKDPARANDMPAVDHDNTAWLTKLILDVGHGSMAIVSESRTPPAPSSSCSTAAICRSCWPPCP